MDSIQLQDFLPKYPNIQKSKYSLLNPYKDSLEQSIYNKKEFNELKLRKDEEPPNKKGELFDRQKIITRFLSSYTPYERLLVFHTMGSGKCLHPHTLITIYIGEEGIKTVLNIEELWEKYNNGFIEYIDGGFWSSPNELIMIDCIDPKTGEMKKRPIKRLYKELFSGFLDKVSLCNGKIIYKTRAHKLYTFVNKWTSILNAGMTVACIPDKDSSNFRELNWCNVSRVESHNYSGAVYDLEIDEYHNYFADTFLSHNTCSAFGTTEEIREQDIERTMRGESPLYKGVLVLARGRGLLNNLINELVFKCSKDEKYIPADFESLTNNEKKRRIKKLTGEYYNFATFYTFAKMIGDYTDKRIKERFSNKIVIIDEVHNIRKIEDKKEDVKVTYDQIFRFLHTIENCKVLLLSGTPMRDTADEIGMIMNLILPIDRQLPTDRDFVEEYMEENRDNVLIVRNDKKEELKTYFRGRVSYLSNIENVQKKFIGDYRIFNIKTFTINRLIMSKNQTRVYKKAYKRDNTGRTGIYSNSRQSSLFVYPDNLYGNKGFETLKSGKSGYKLSDNLKNLFTGTIEQKLETLKEYSIKYYTLIKNLLETKGRSGFVYSNIVRGSGIIILSLILTQFGFTSANGSESSKGKRFAILTNETTNPTMFSRLIDRFNSNDNYRGEYIQIIIGSKVISEGLSFSNVQDIYILTPYWNYSETSQAIYRGIREGSHRVLIDNGIVPDIKIYQMAAIPDKEGVPSIDMQMYTISASKDLSMKSVERVIKESAFDCQLTRNINYKSNMEDYTRECEYEICDYKCDGITSTDMDIDYSTYNLYYTDETFKKIKEKIKSIFRDKFITDFTELKEGNNFESTKILDRVVNDPMIVYDKYGFMSYVKENKNSYFIVNDISTDSTPLSDYYSKYPYILGCKTFDEIYISTEAKIIIEQVEKLKANPEKDDIYSFLTKLPNIFKELILELCMIIKEKNIIDSIDFSNIVLDYFSQFLSIVNGVTISSQKYDETGLLRCYTPADGWKDCTEELYERWRESKQEKRQDLENNPYGYYGIYDPIKKSFYIRDVRKKQSKEAEDKRKIFIGSKCTETAWSREKIAQLALDISLDYPQDFGQEYTKAEALKKALENKNAKNIVNDSMSKTDILRVLYWASKQKKVSCAAIQEWFAENGLLQIGTKEKKKE